LIVVIWLALGGAAVWLDIHKAQSLQLCTFKDISGIPCPACGFSRGMLSLLQGNVLQAWLYNPLLFSVLGLFFILTAVRLLFGRQLQLKPQPGERPLAWIGAIGLVLANWVYIILYVG